MKKLYMHIALSFLLTSCIYEHFYYLEGNIIDKETRKPVGNVDVEGDRMKTVRSDSLGKFLLFGHSKAYGVSFSKNGYNEFVFIKTKKDKRKKVTIEMTKDKSVGNAPFDK